MMADEEMDYCNGLPDYLIAQIFSLLTDLPDQKNVRLVCDSWREIWAHFDTHHTTKIRGRLSTLKDDDDEDNNLEKIRNCSIPISTLQIDPEGLGHGLLDWEKIGTVENKIPDGLKEIFIASILHRPHVHEDENENNNNMKTNNLQIIFKTVASHLEKLSFSLLDTCKPLRLHLGHQDSGFCMEKLTELTIQVHELSQLKIFGDFLRHEIQFPRLTSINFGFLSQKIYYSDPNIVGFILNGHTLVKEVDQELCQPYYDLYGLLLRHWDTLQNVTLVYPPILEFNEEVRVLAENQKIIDQLYSHHCGPSQLKKLTLSFLGETGRQDGDECDLAYPLLRSQSNLKEMEYLTAPLSMLGWAGYPQFLDGIKSNCDTVQKVTITNRNPHTWSLGWTIPLFEGTSHLSICSKLVSVNLDFLEVPVDILHFFPPILQNLRVVGGGLEPVPFLSVICKNFPVLKKLVFIPLMTPPPPPHSQVDEEEDDDQPNLMEEDLPVMINLSQLRNCFIDLCSMSKLWSIQVPREYLTFVENCVTTRQIKLTQFIPSSHHHHQQKSDHFFEMDTVDIRLNK